MSVNLIFKRFRNYREYYNVLGVGQGSSSKEIKDSFHKLSKIYHPDNKTTGDNAKFLQISQAYEAIKDREVCDNVPVKDKGYDASIYGQQKQKVQPIYRRQEPLSMEHIERVYRRINEGDKVEPEPSFKIFEDHHYPNTTFNRFEYVRKWDPQSKVWVYKKRPSVEDYQNRLRKNDKRLKYIILTCMSGVAFMGFNYKLTNWIHRIAKSRWFRPRVSISLNCQLV